MKDVTKVFSAALAAFALTLAAGPAAADGLAARTAQIPAAARASLSAAIASDRAARPAAYRAVLEVRGVRPEVYRTFRNPLPNAAPELRAMGADALLPMLAALAFDAPAAQRSEGERLALTAGMVEAVGLLRDARSGPVLLAALENASKEPVLARAAAEAMGRLCGDPELSALERHGATGDPLREAAVRGLGACRRVEAASYLAGALAGASDDATAMLVADALGVQGSSWAWKAMGPSAEPTGLAIREVAARALVDAFPRRTGDAQARIGRSILLVEHPVSTELLLRARASARPEVQASIDALQKQLERRLAH